MDLLVAVLVEVPLYAFAVVELALRVRAVPLCKVAVAVPRLGYVTHVFVVVPTVPS